VIVLRIRELEAEIERLRRVADAARAVVAACEGRPGTVTDWLRHELPGGWTAHSLRHAFATDFFTASGFDLLWTAEVLGHSSVETTKRYVHVQRPADAVVRQIGSRIMVAA
jgi:integrase